MRLQSILSALLVAALPACSCDNEKPRVAYDLFDQLTAADSLLAAGQDEMARSILDGVVGKELVIEHPGLFKRLWWAVVSYVDTEEMDLFHDYFFSYLAQMEAISVLADDLSRTPEERLENEMKLFSLTPDFDRVAADYVRRFSQSEYKFGDFRQFCAGYKKLVRSHGRAFLIADDRNNSTKLAYRKKWSLMSRLLMDCDAMNGYDETFSFFDGILKTHGASVEAFTKSLVKTYMSFSGKEQYAYETTMTYEDFKGLGECHGEWTLVKEKQWSFVTGTSQSVDDGILLSNGRLEFLNPGALEIWVAVSDSTVCISNDDEIVRRIYQYFFKRDNITLDRQVLHSILCHHGIDNHDEMYIAQEVSADTLIRRGRNGDFIERLKYKCGNKLLLLEKSLFDLDGNPAVDVEGIHLTRNLYDEEDNLFERWFETVPGKKMTADQKAHVVYSETDDGMDVETFYNVEGNMLYKEVSKFDGDLNYHAEYDSIDRLVYEDDGKTQKKIVYSDTTKTVTSTFENAFGAYMKVVETEHFGYENEFPLVHLAKVVESYQFGGGRYLLMQRARFFAGNNPYSGQEGWANETYQYNEWGWLTVENHFDVDGKYAGGSFYDYYEGSDGGMRVLISNQDKDFQTVSSRTLRDGDAKAFLDSIE